MNANRQVKFNAIKRLVEELCGTTAIPVVATSLHGLLCTTNSHYNECDWLSGTRERPSEAVLAYTSLAIALRSIVKKGNVKDESVQT